MKMAVTIKWTSVAKELPPLCREHYKFGKCSTEVLVAQSNGGVQTAQYFEEDKQWAHWGQCVPDVRFWAYLPSAPRD